MNAITRLYINNVNSPGAIRRDAQKIYNEELGFAQMLFARWMSKNWSSLTLQSYKVEKHLSIDWKGMHMINKS